MILSVLRFIRLTEESCFTLLYFTVEGHFCQNVFPVSDLREEAAD
jgi:hypothetical protein